jgi:hypothetical protein
LINIFTEHITNRLHYVLDFCFEQKGQAYQLISTEQEWIQCQKKDLNYSNLSLEANLTIVPQGILYESDIYLQKELSIQNNRILIDGVHDPLSVIFFYLTRYEDYQSANYDNHDRISTVANSLVRLKRHRKPEIDQLVMTIWNELSLDYLPVQDGFKLLPTFDIDIAWAYKNRKFGRALGSMLKGAKPLERLKVLSGIQKDPYDTYSTIIEINSHVDKVICFILLGDWGKFDKNIHWENDNFGQLIKMLDKRCELGIHPSYASHLQADKIKNEIERLEKIIGHEISQSRQHFLRLRFPETYYLLIKAGVTKDYSMGFADEVGFKAGTSFPFYFFDLNANIQTSLMIQPFMYMDSALKDYLKYSPEKAQETVQLLIKEVKEVGGEFCFIWHNSSIHDKGEWNGWKEILDFTLNVGLADEK